MTATPRKKAARGHGATTRQQLLDAAAELLEERGHIDRVSVSDIVTRIGVTPPVLYSHFDDKQALFATVHAIQAEDLRRVLQLAARRGRTALTALERRGHAYVNWAVEHPDAYEALFLERNGLGSTVFAHEVAAGESPFADLAANIQSCIDEGSFAAGDVAIMARSIWSTVHGVASLAIALPDAFGSGDIERVITTTVKMISAGFAPSPASNRNKS
jgi:AcrR family transcriptional regulator